jgi:hypothetical protein
MKVLASAFYLLGAIGLLQLAWLPRTEFLEWLIVGFLTLEAAILILRSLNAAIDAAIEFLKSRITSKPH